MILWGCRLNAFCPRSLARAWSSSQTTSSMKCHNLLSPHIKADAVQLGDHKGERGHESPDLQLPQVGLAAFLINIFILGLKFSIFYSNIWVGCF